MPRANLRTSVPRRRYGCRMSAQRGGAAVAVDFDEARFRSPICTVRDVADLVGMPAATVQNWAGQRARRPQLIAHSKPATRGWPSIPLVGLVEAATLRGMRSHLPAREVWEAARWIEEHLDSPHPLAHERLVTDGFKAYVDELGGNLYHLRTNQQVIRESIEEQLRPVVFADDHYPLQFQVLRLGPGVVIDPRFNAGRMYFARNGTPLFAVLGALAAGEEAAEVADAYRLTRDEVAIVERHRDWLEQAA